MTAAIAEERGELQQFEGLVESGVKGCFKR